MPRPNRVFSKTIRLERDDHVDFKTWIAPIVNIGSKKFAMILSLSGKFISKSMIFNWG
ncbi:MAG TPA: hypothetical protein PKC68_02620 [Alphaproteobacteria bacterium]|nr:hypothetical protein [Alphaproteobacteria bacterium]